MLSIVLPVKVADPFTFPRGYSEPSEIQEHLQIPVHKKLYEKVAKDFQGLQSHVGRWQLPEKILNRNLKISHSATDVLNDSMSQPTQVRVPIASSKGLK